ncbi:zinc-ribbon domain-containing protein [Rhodococcoides fascians]|uniref:zinc-ribbon domain-containing protein n=1 Tax=Rhodococcoides fascians TaxID=1828 RepID=UPI0009B899B1
MRPLADRLWHLDRNTDVHPSDLKPKSHTRVWWQCPDCRLNGEPRLAATQGVIPGRETRRRPTTHREARQLARKRISKLPRSGIRPETEVSNPTESMRAHPTTIGGGARSASTSEKPNLRTERNKRTCAHDAKFRCSGYR